MYYFPGKAGNMRQNMGIHVRISILLCLAGMFAGQVVHAQNDHIQRGPVPKWAVLSDPLPVPADAAGALFIRRQDTEVHLNNKGQQIFDSYRVKLLHANALQLGNLSVTWNPAAGSPTVHYINIYRDGAVINVLEKSSFEILRREDQLEAARLDGNLTAVLRIPDLRVGDELEFGATTPSNDPTLGSNDAGFLFLGQDPSPGRFHLRLGWDKGSQPTVKMTPDMTAVAQQGADGIDFRFDNPATLSGPKDAPPRYQWLRIVEFSRFADWAALSRRFTPLFETASRLGANSPLKQEAATIAAAHPLPFDRASAALKLVQQNVRYIYVGLNGGNLTPATADETWQRRYGDCKAKTALLLALLHELGIQAQAVLVNNSGADDGFNERLPSPRLFDHVLVRARLDDKTYWLDGTLPAVALPSTMPIIPYRWVLPVADNGSGLEHLDWAPEKQPQQVSLYEIDARAGFDKPARITNTTIIRGIEGLQQEVQFSAVTPTQLLTAFRQKAIGDTWQTIEDVQWHYDQKARASILSIVGTGTVDWSDDGAGAKSLALPGGGFNPPEKRLRPAEQNQTLPYYNKPEYDCRVTTVRLPTTTTPGQWSHKDNIDARMFGRTYYRAFDLRDGSLRMIRGTRVEQMEVTAANAGFDNARIPRFDNSMAWINYDPKGNTPPFKAPRPVPATYEIDWTGNDVPCLAPPQVMMNIKSR